MRTRTIGEILKEARIAHHISIDQLAKKTRIRTEYLLALENSEYDKLPAAAFVRGYIKTYAQAFGFDSGSLLALLRRDYKESVKGKLVPREFLKPVIKKRRVTTPITIVMVGLIGFFMSLVGYVAVQWYNLQKPPFLEVSQPINQAQVAARVMVVGKTDVESIVLVNEQPVSLQPDGSFNTEIVLPTEGLTTITISSTDRKGKMSKEQKTVYVRF